MVESGIYIHIPFCRRRCSYCHFAIAAHQPKREALFLDALQREWERRKSALADTALLSIYFGGGTPSLLAPAQIAKILSWFPSAQEITLEANPEDVTLERMRGYFEAGINRVSLGVQTLNDTLLKSIGRTHSALQALNAIDATYDAGITNISCDLILELPGQTIADIEHAVSTLITTAITHLSLYNLTLEAPAPYFFQRASLRLPDQETALKMLQTAVLTITQASFRRYEISAFCRGPHHSVHNTGYWLGRRFLGLGPSASSYLNGVRTQNTRRLQSYLETDDSTELVDALCPKARERELLAIGLRLLEGVDLNRFPTARASLPQLASDGLITIEGHWARLTERGLLLHDTIAATII